MKVITGEKRGLLPRIIENLFEVSDEAIPVDSNNQAEVNRSFLISFFEIYNEKVYDLLSKVPNRHHQ